MDTVAPPSQARRRATLAAAYLGTFLATLDISIVNVALPTLQTALHTDISGLQWVINAYAVCLSAFMLSAGPLGDRFGHKRAWLSGVLVFTIGSALCGFASSLGILLAGRALQGVAAALMIPGAMTLLSRTFPDPAERAHVIGGWSAFTALALIVGPLAGGLLLAAAGWQSIFLINLPLGLVALGLGAWGIREWKYPQHAALNPAGQILSVLTLGALSYGLITAGEHGHGQTVALVALGLALLCLASFVIVEWRSARPLLPLALFRQRPFASANFASFALGFSYYSSLFFVSLYLQQIHGWSAVQTGWRMTPQFLMTACMSLLFGRLNARFGLPRLMTAGYALTGLSLAAMAMLDAHSAYWQIGLVLATLGLGAGLAVPATGLAVMASAPAERSGMASATMNALRQTGMAIGIALLGTVMSERAIAALTELTGGDRQPAISAITQQVFATPLLRDAYSTAMVHGFHAAMLASGLVCLLALALLRWR